jgi:hypothetical protein
MRELTGPPPPEPVRAVRADALERADRAWTARVTGSTWREAAEIGGYSSDKHAMNAARRVYGELPRIDRDELRRLWRDRLESAWRQVAEDMRDRVPGATTAAVRIVTAAAALDGLNEPTKVDVSADDFLGLFTRELNDAGF